MALPNKFADKFADKKALWQTVLPFLCAAGVFVACLTCAVFVWYQYLGGIQTKTQRNLLNDAYTTTTAPMQDSVPVTQEFQTLSPIYEVGVYFERLSETVSGTLYIQLLDLDTGAVLLDTTGSIASVYYDSYTFFTLPEPVLYSGEIKSYMLIVTASYQTDADQLTLKKSDVAIDYFTNLTENGAAAEGAIALSVTYDVLGSTPTLCFFVLSALFALCAAGLCLLCFFSKGKFALGKPWLAFLVIFAAGLFYQFALPAFSVPDEVSHYNTAYAISNSWLGRTPESEGATLVKRSTDAQSTYVDYYTDAFTYRYMAEHFFDAPDGTYIEESVTILGPYNLPYYLSAIGLTLGQLLGWGGIFTTFLTRCLNLAFFAAAAALSIKLVPYGKNIFAAVALLPITLHMGGSYSYDSCLLAIAFLLLALGIRLATQTGKLNWAEVGVFGWLCFLIGPLKMAYFPLTFIAVFIPAKRFAKRWQGMLVRFGLPLLSILHFSVRNFLAVLVQFSVFTDLTYTASTTGTAELQAGVDYTIGTYTVSPLLAYPGVALKLIVNTFFTNFTDYFTDMLGATLGYQDLAEVNINLLLIFAFGLLLAYATIKKEGEASLPAWQRCTIGVISICVIGILAVACLSWTLLTYKTLWGFQGRYLLPVLGFALLALQPAGITVKGAHSHAVVLFGGFLLNFLVLLNVVSITFVR